MGEVLKEQAPQEFDLQSILDLMHRRHLPFLLLLFLGWCTVWGASWLLPPRYKSTTLILVEQPTMPKNYVAPNVSDNLQDRLQSITQQILSRTRLLFIIDKLHLYRDAKSSSTPDWQVGQMRKDIDIELVRNQLDEITSFTVSYSARDPHIAQSVTTELTKLFINDNLETRQQESQDNTTFLQNQLNSAQTSLAAQEAKVREFEAEHEGDLPSQQASNLQILSGLQSQLQSEQDALNTARQQRVYYEALIEQYREAPPVLKADGTPAQSSPIDLIDEQLAGLRTKLVDLSSRYTDRYPGVIALKEQIADVEEMRQKIEADARRKASESKESGKSAAGDKNTDSAESATLLQMQGQLQANQLEITNRERSIAALQARIDDYQTRLNGEPAVEEQLADLTRGYDQSQTDYNDLLKKKNESEMATSMEEMQQGERFTILDPPSLPLRPAFPNRLKFCEMGLGVGLALGLTLVIVLEVLDDRIHKEQELRALLSIPVIAEIPTISSPADERTRKMRLSLGWATSALVVLAILAGSAISFLHR
ncbi:MAG: hypothetical protein WBV33_13085 [Terracidiphilus sp.]